MNAAAVDAIVGTSTLVSPVDGVDRRFERVFTLTVATGGEADAVSFDAAAARLQGAFATRTYDALSAPAPLRARLTAAQGGGAVVELDGPRGLAGVGLTGAQPSHVDVHRVDGAVPADDATTGVPVLPASATVHLAPGGVGTTFLTAAMSASVEHPPASGLPPSGPGGLGGVVAVGGLGGAGAELGELVFAQGPSFEADRFALRAAGVPLGADRLRAVHVVAAPANPALLLRLAASDEPPVLLWAGAVQAATAFDVGATLAAEAQRLLDGLAAPLPPTVTLQLFARADGPCSVAVSAVALPYRLITRRFAATPLRRSDAADGGALQRALRFPTDAVAASLRGRLTDGTRAALDSGTDVLDRVLAELDAVLATPWWDPGLFAGVELPPAIAALAAEAPSGERRVLLNRTLLEAALPGVLFPANERRVLDVIGAVAAPVLGVRRPASAAAVDATLVVAPSVQDRAGADASMRPAAARGGEIADGATLATRFAVERPVRAVAIDVGVLTTTDRVRLDVALRRDVAGTPEGAVVAAAAAVMPPPGQAGWARADLGFTLQPEPYWLTVRAAGGPAVWLAGDATGTPVYHRAPGDAVWQPAGTGPLALQARVVTAGDGSQSPVAAVAGAVAAAASVLASGEVTLDLGPALTSTAPGTTLPLRLTASGDGQLTIAPPEVAYDL